MSDTKEAFENATHAAVRLMAEHAPESDAFVVSESLIEMQQLMVEALLEVLSFGDSQDDGWIYTMASSNVLWAGNQLVRLGVCERKDGGKGRCQWFRLNRPSKGDRPSH